PDEVSKLAPERRVLAVRADFVLQVAVFAALPAEANAASLLGPADGPYALFGPAHDVAPRLAAFLRGDSLQTALPVVTLPQPAALSAVDKAAARRTTATLLRLAAKPTDGIVSRNVNRRVSRFFSRIFLAWRMTPMHASVLNLAIGLACA